MASLNNLLNKMIDAINVHTDAISGGIEVGSVDWSNVQNKPFTTVGGDTLTWDGNTEGLYSVDLGFSYQYRISDATPTLEDFANGGSVTYSDGTVIEFTADEVGDISGGMLMLNDNPLIVIPSDNFTPFDVTFEKKGIYTEVLRNGTKMVSLTINGYTGFTKEVIKQEVLPEALQFGETVTTSDTITWDGNTEGLECFPFSPNKTLYLISDIYPPMEEFKNGGTVTYNDGTNSMPMEVRMGNVSDSFGVEAYFGLTDDGQVLLLGVSQDVDSDGMSLKKGLYVLDFGAKVGVKTSAIVTINGYKFITKTFTPIDKKYIPMGVGGGGFRINVTMNDNDEYVSDKTYAEITEAITNGFIPYVTFDRYVFQWCMSNILTEIDTFMAAYDEHSFSCLAREKSMNINIFEDGSVDYIELTFTTA